MASIFLIGPMGSGKSTVGKALARKINYPFLDVDREIESRCGVDIPTIFEFEGEAGFRDREKKILTELTSLDPVVLATGGGAILKRGNRKLLRDKGHVIMLAVEIEEQLRRVSLNKNRPLLQGGDVEEKLRKLMLERSSLYEATAHHIISTNSSRMQNVVTKITRHLLQNEIIAPLPAKSPRRATSRSGKEPVKAEKKASTSATAQNRQNASGSNTASTKTSTARKKTAKAASASGGRKPAAQNSALATAKTKAKVKSSSKKRSKKSNTTD